MLTLPVTTASAERPISQLRRLKRYLRSAMGEERVNGPSLLNVHRKVKLNVGHIVDIFARQNLDDLTLLSETAMHIFL